jgi:hypothetical protein
VNSMVPAVDRTREAPGAAVRGGLMRFSLVLPGILMAASLCVLAVYCQSLLSAAAAGRPVVIGGLAFWAAFGTFFAACVGAIALHCVRLATRVAGPEYRLRRALQRIRAHDVGFRVSLRRGDLLTGLARECNELLDWLNRNPPSGMRTGGDVVEVGDLASEAATTERSRP